MKMRVIVLLGESKSQSTPGENEAATRTTPGKAITVTITPIKRRSNTTIHNTTNTIILGWEELIRGQAVLLTVFQYSKKKKKKEKPYCYRYYTEVIE